MVWCVCIPDSLQLLSYSVQTICGCGPHTWAKKYLQAAGNRQSPIDIQTNDVVPDPKLSRNQLHWVYPKKTVEILNTGYCWKAHVHGEGSVLEGGPLQHQYQLEQYHCHWGAEDSVGSEHLVDGQSYAGEIHFVHWNTKYGSFNEALKHGDGLAVLGVFLKVGKEHAELNKLTRMLHHIQYKDETAVFHDSLDPSRLLPENHSYWTYLGSLTTPPCNECVVWIVFKEPIEVSEKQMEAFRSMSCSDKDSCHGGPMKMVNNYRPPLSRGDRVVRASYT